MMPGTCKNAILTNEKGVLIALTSLSSAFSCRVAGVLNACPVPHLESPCFLLAAAFKESEMVGIAFVVDEKKGSGWSSSLDKAAILWGEPNT